MKQLYIALALVIGIGVTAASAYTCCTTCYGNTCMTSCW